MTDHEFKDADKVRVSQCRVVEVFDAPGLIRDGWMAGADLAGAKLTGADLSGANLSRANLYGANLYGADGRDDWDALVKRGALR